MSFRRDARAACVLGSMLISGCNGCEPVSPGEAQRGSGVPSQTTAGAASSVDSSGYAGRVAQIDKQLIGLQKLVAARDGDWLMREHLAAALLERAGLTGRVEDYLRAERALDETFAVGEVGTGPKLLRARFNYAVHRLEKADEQQRELAGYKVLKKEQLLAVDLLGAQIAFQRGRYQEAGTALEAIATASPKLARTELALFYAKTGRAPDAVRLFEQTLAEASTDDRRQRAWLGLQLGILAMESGRYEDALKLLTSADAEFRGWWLVQEHIAEVHTLLGHEREATTIYEAVVAQTELPQYMDALAGCYGRLGRKPEAEALVARARTAWKKQLADLPESAMGHGLEHFLEHGSAAEALELAKKNHAVRPGGEAQVLLARAHLKAENPTAAVEVLEQTLSTAYRSADLHGAASEAYAALGKTALAGSQRALALAMNPRYYDATTGAEGTRRAPPEDPTPSTNK